MRMNFIKWKNNDKERERVILNMANIFAIGTLFYQINVSFLYSMLNGDQIHHY